MQTTAHDSEHPAVGDRPDLPRGFLDTAWPLAALALLLLMLVRACMPVAPASVPVSLFDPAGAAQQANESALEALRALLPEPELPAALDVLNGVVVNFASASDRVPADAADVLQAAAAVIAALPAESRLLITGHTDNVGDTAGNLVLSRRRAQAVRAALIGYGAPAAALSVHGVGDSRPLADNSSEAGRFRNRRIEFSAIP